MVPLLDSRSKGQGHLFIAMELNTGHLSSQGSVATLSATLFAHGATGPCLLLEAMTCLPRV
jgi:hypothetical protein